MENSTKKGMALWKKILIGFVALVAVSAFYAGFKDGGSGATAAEKYPKEKLTTAYVKAKRTLKTNLKDPDSFQEINHKEYYVSGKDSLLKEMQVVIDYRSKNSFGGYVVGKQIFTFDSTGTITETLDGLK